MKGLTHRQYVVLRALAKNEPTPSVRELMVLLDVSAEQGVQDHLHRLQDKGYISRRAPRLARAWVVTKAGLKALHQAEAEAAGMEKP